MQYQVAPLKRRFAALMYESLLVASVAILAGLAAGALNTVITHSLPALLAITPFLTMLFLLFAWWLYFKLNWLREGQTLPMRVWHIGLHDKYSGSRPNLNRLRLRFAWSVVFLLFIPISVYACLRYGGIAAKPAIAMALFWWILPWGFAFFNPRRQFLYDFLAGTELIDLR